MTRAAPILQYGLSDAKLMPMRTFKTSSVVTALAVGSVAVTIAPQTPAQAPAFTRLSAEPIELPAAAGRVEGDPGSIRIVETSCRVLPRAELRHRIVDIVLTQWALFGHTVLDQTNIDESATRDRGQWRARRPRSWLDAEEAARVAHSIAGYWSSTADGAWILDRQNAVWRGSDGMAARWRDPWSAAFVSWVMCEAGLDERQFKRAIAHHVYIDQAIAARDEASSEAAYFAYDVGETEIEPGDMLCSARRNAYGSIADRRRALGVGVRSHCDIVVEIDPANDRVLAIGGNVRGAVRLKLLPAEFDELGRARSVGRGGRTVFAHLKLRADPITADAFPVSLAAMGKAAAP